ncbi:Syntaxin-binding protein 1 [Cladochytrium tenue]|nr:Syntaxin-binding protein 1 [Cladochytrium tenue]
MASGSLKDIVRKAIFDRMSKIPSDAANVLVVDVASEKLLRNSKCTPDELQALGIRDTTSILTKRIARPNWFGVYFISPTGDSVRRMISDFVSSSTAMYEAGFVFFTSPLRDSLFAEIQRSGALPYLRQLIELDIDFTPLESRVFHIGYEHAAEDLYGSVSEEDLDYVMTRIAKKLRAVFATMNEDPLIRYYDPNKDGTSMPAILAHKLHGAMQELKSFDDTFPTPTPYDDDGPATVLIVDRAIDVLTPLLHTLSYECLLWDLFEVKNVAEKSQNNFVVEVDVDGDVKEAVVDEIDEIYANKLRLLLIYIILVDGLKQEDVESLAERAGIEADDLVAIQGLCSFGIQLGTQKDVRDPESPFTKQARRRMIENALSNNSGSSAALGGVDFTGLFKRLNLGGKGEKDAIREALAADNFLPVSEVSSFDRFHPAIGYIIQDHILGRLHVAGTADSGLFPFVESPEVRNKQQGRASVSRSSGQGDRGPGVVMNLRESTTLGNFRWSRARPTPVGVDHFRFNGPRTVLFIIGGATRAEMRAIYLLSKKLQREIYLGSTHIMNPSAMVSVLEFLGRSDQAKEVAPPKSQLPLVPGKSVKRLSMLGPVTAGQQEPKPVRPLPPLPPQGQPSDSQPTSAHSPVSSSAASLQPPSSSHAPASPSSAHASMASGMNKITSSFNLAVSETKAHVQNFADKAKRLGQGADRPTPAALRPHSPNEAARPQGVASFTPSAAYVSEAPSTDGPVSPATPGAQSAEDVSARPASYISASGPTEQPASSSAASSRPTSIVASTTSTSDIRPPQTSSLGPPSAGANNSRRSSVVEAAAATAPVSLAPSSSGAVSDPSPPASPARVSNPYMTSSPARSPRPRHDSIPPPRVASAVPGAVAAQLPASVAIAGARPAPPPPAAAAAPVPSAYYNPGMAPQLQIYYAQQAAVAAAAAAGSRPAPAVSAPYQYPASGYYGYPVAQHGAIPPLPPGYPATAPQQAAAYLRAQSPMPGAPPGAAAAYLRAPSPAPAAGGGYLRAPSPAPAAQAAPAPQAAAPSPYNPYTAMANVHTASRPAVYLQAGAAAAPAQPAVSPRPQFAAFAPQQQQLHQPYAYAAAAPAGYPAAAAGYPAAYAAAAYPYAQYPAPPPPGAAAAARPGPAQGWVHRPQNYPPQQ